jgi:hypothetical protein
LDAAKTLVNASNAQLLDADLAPEPNAKSTRNCKTKG